MGEIFTSDHTNVTSQDELLRNIVLDVERISEGKGWETEETGPMNTFVGILFGESAKPDAQPNDPSMMFISPLPIDPDMYHDVPTLMSVLATIPARIAYEWIKDAIDNGNLPLGVMLSCEAWTIRSGPDGTLTPDQWAAAHNRGIHARPDRVECRQVTLCMYDGRMVVANRLRGEEPTVHIQQDGASDVQFIGRLVTSLRALTRIVVGPLWEGDR